MRPRRQINNQQMTTLPTEASPSGNQLIPSSYPISFTNRHIDPTYPMPLITAATQVAVPPALAHPKRLFMQGGGGFDSHNTSTSESKGGVFPSEYQKKSIATASHTNTILNSELFSPFRYKSTGTAATAPLTASNVVMISLNGGGGGNNSSAQQDMSSRQGSGGGTGSPSRSSLSAGRM